jgi:hypothetical protein
MVSFWSAACPSFVFGTVRDFVPRFQFVLIFSVSRVDNAAPGVLGFFLVIAAKRLGSEK